MATKNKFYSLKPFFDGNVFSLWKHQIEFFLNSDDIDLWEIIESDFCIDKPRGDWNENNLKLFSLNLKAMQVSLQEIWCIMTEISIIKCVKTIIKSF